MEFKDKEELRLELERILGWAPGRSMIPPRPAVLILPPPSACAPSSRQMAGAAGRGSTCCPTSGIGIDDCRLKGRT